MQNKYESFPLQHENGGIICHAFWRASPISKADAQQKQILCDCVQEMHVIAIEALLEKIEGAKDLSNFAQRQAYLFWKNMGFRKDRDGQKISWRKKEKPLEEE